jgi:hypothetical protein
VALDMDWRWWLVGRSAVSQRMVTKTGGNWLRYNGPTIDLLCLNDHQNSQLLTFVFASTRALSNPVQLHRLHCV